MFVVQKAENFGDHGLSQQFPATPPGIKSTKTAHIEMTTGGEYFTFIILTSSLWLFMPILSLW